MKIVKTVERLNMEERHAEIGFSFAEMDNSKYWDETQYIEFTSEEIDKLEQAGNVCFHMAMAAVDAIMKAPNVDAELLSLGIPANMLDAIKLSYSNERVNSLYARADFALTLDADGKLLPKLYEINADTPTSLLEASIVQWQWLEDCYHEDQFNLIHERLMQRMTYMLGNKVISSNMYFAAQTSSIEDTSTVAYMEEIFNSIEGNSIPSKLLDIESIGLMNDNSSFVDIEDGTSIATIFKLYPWEQFATGEFFKYVPDSSTKWINPMWRLVMSSKGLLAKMYELFPNNEYLIETYIGSPNNMTSYACKPCLSREGNGIVLVDNGNILADTSTSYEENLVYQKLTTSFNTDEGHYMAGVWLIEPNSDDSVACGMGIRLDGSITGDAARFIPHVFIN
jgi:glutathionylspermidine synthase